MTVNVAVEEVAVILRAAEILSLSHNRLIVAKVARDPDQVVTEVDVVEKAVVEQADKAVGEVAKVDQEAIVTATKIVVVMEVTRTRV
jgi:hypothetical protein